MLELFRNESRGIENKEIKGEGKPHIAKSLIPNIRSNLPKDQKRFVDEAQECYRKAASESHQIVLKARESELASKRIDFSSLRHTYLGI